MMFLQCNTNLDGYFLNNKRLIETFFGKIKLVLLLLFYDD